jgi:hypothetical protein
VRWTGASLAAACIGAAAVCGWAASARGTTTPGVLHVSKLVLTDRAILIRDEFMTRAGFPRYPRGSDVRYDVSNRGTRAFTLNILGSSTGSLRPGRKTTILVYWGRRGRFVFRALPNGPRIRVRVD